MLYEYNLRVVLYWVVSIFIGLSIGAITGLLLAGISYNLDISEGKALLLTLLVLGLAMIIWLVPIENEIYISKIKKIRFDINNPDHKYGMPPMLLFFLIGSLIGEKHYYHIMLGKHCLLPVMCADNFCLFGYCF